MLVDQYGNALPAGASPVYASDCGDLLFVLSAAAPRWDGTAWHCAAAAVAAGLLGHLVVPARSIRSGRHQRHPKASRRRRLSLRLRYPATRRGLQISMI